MVLAVIAALGVGLGGFSAGARAEIGRRIAAALEGDRQTCSVEGAVTGVGDGFFFLQQGGEALKVHAESGRLPSPGEVVRVEGRSALEGGRVLLAATGWTRTGTAELPPPVPIGYAEMVNPGEPSDGSPSVNWLRVEVTGRAIERTGNGFAVEVGGVPVTVLAGAVPEFVETCGRTRPRVRVTGVVELVLDQSVLFGRRPYVMGVKLQVNSSADIELLPDALYLANVRDGRMIAAVAAAFVLLAVGLAFLAAVIVRQRRRNFRAQTLMAERKRMADDIHDTIEQHLVGAGMLLQLGRNQEARDILLRAKRELRDIIWGLKNDDMLRMKPSEMLAALAKDETEKGVVLVEAALAGVPERLPAQAMRDLMLIVREAIGNAVKHGRAKRVWLHSASAVKGWCLTVANDGTPFDASAAQGSEVGHFGLAGMRERALRIGAAVSIGVEDGRTTVRIEFAGKGDGK